MLLNRQSQAHIRVSVIIPARNAEDFIDEAIDSVLSQASVDTEILVIDDGSIDHTAQRAESHNGVRVLRQAPQGISSARNAGLWASRGELIAFNDADDLWCPGKLESQLELLDREPETAMVMSQVEHFSEDGRALPAWAPPGVSEVMLLQCACIRRSVFEAIGRFDERMTHSEDLDFFVRMIDAGMSFARIPQVHVRRRVHASNHCHHEEQVAVARLEVLRRSSRRRRLAAKPRPISPSAQP